MAQLSTGDDVKKIASAQDIQVSELFISTLFFLTDYFMICIKEYYLI